MQKDLLRVDGSIQSRSTFVAPSDFELRTGDTVILRRDDEKDPERILALVESAVASKDIRGRAVTGTLQLLARIDERDELRAISAVPPFYAEVDFLDERIGGAFYGCVSPATDPVTKLKVQPSALAVGSLLTAPDVPVVFDASGFNRHTALLAQSGAGKSYALGVLAEELLAKTSIRLVVLDPNGDFARLRELEAGAHAILASSRDPLPYRSAVRRMLAADTHCVVFNLNPLDGALWSAVVEDILAQLWENRDARRATIILIDEAHNFAPEGTLGDERAGLTIRRIAAEGRKYGLWLLLASQRPQKLNANVISQCDNLIVMRLSSQYDIEHVAGSYGAIDRNMMQLTAGFKSGSALVVGRLVKAPTLLRFRERKMPEGGGDISLEWACGAPPARMRKGRDAPKAA